MSSATDPPPSESPNLSSLPVATAATADHAAPAAAPRPRSLRVEILVSYLSLLAVVVVGFGSSIYIIVRHGIYRQAESELLGFAQMVGHELRTQGTANGLRIPPPPQHRFGPAPRDHSYFAIYDAQDRWLAGTDPIPVHLQDERIEPPRNLNRAFYSAVRGIHLDVVVKEPDGTRIVVGRPLGRELDQLWLLLVVVSFFGMVSLVAGAAGAWWLARRIVQPVENMTATAELITARNLDQRLDVERTPAELLRLKSVFNMMLDRLQAAFQRQIRFTADASHELRTPVAVILSQAEHTLSRPRSTEDYCAALETCLRAARRMKRLVDDLLLLARADSGRLELRLEPVDLAEVARQSLGLLEPLARDHQVRLASQLQSTLLRGDAARLGQVVTNLVTNGILYNRTEGEVFVTVHGRETGATLVVSDTGIGIAQTDQPRLFERFFRVDQARRQGEGQGTGLGLSIVSEIVAAHQGTIEVTSEPGVGTTVTVQFPPLQTDAASDS